MGYLACLPDGNALLLDLTWFAQHATYLTWLFKFWNHYLRTPAAVDLPPYPRPRYYRCTACSYRLFPEEGQHCHWLRTRSLYLAYLPALLGLCLPCHTTRLGYLPALPALCLPVLYATPTPCAHATVQLCLTTAPRTYCFVLCMQLFFPRWWLDKLHAIAGFRTCTYTCCLPLLPVQFITVIAVSATPCWSHTPGWDHTRFVWVLGWNIYNTALLPLLCLATFVPPTNVAVPQT